MPVGGNGVICGPVHPFGHDGLRQLLRDRPGVIEHGLRLVLEDLDCSRGALGNIDGLYRDAVGRAVWVHVADEQDPALPARVLQTQAFCQRNGEALERALPECGVDFDSFRLLVVGVAIDRLTMEALERVRMPELEVYEIEPFRVGGQERFVLRTMLGARSATDADADLEPALRDLWGCLTTLLTRLDPLIRVSGDRFSKRASWRGRNLCEFWCADGQLAGVVPGSAPRALSTEADVRAFGDRVLRRYLELFENGDRDVSSASAAAEPETRADRPAALRGMTLESLRQSLQATRLTREEYTALGGPATEGEVPKGG